MVKLAMFLARHGAVQHDSPFAADKVKKRPVREVQPGRGKAISVADVDRLMKVVEEANRDGRFLSRADLANRLGIRKETVVWLLRRANLSLLVQHAVADASLATRVRLEQRRNPKWTVHRLAVHCNTYSKKVQSILRDGDGKSRDVELEHAISVTVKTCTDWSSLRIACFVGCTEDKVAQFRKDLLC